MVTPDTIGQLAQVGIKIVQVECFLVLENDRDCVDRNMAHQRDNPPTIARNPRRTNLEDNPLSIDRFRRQNDDELLGFLDLSAYLIRSVIASVDIPIIPECGRPSGFDLLAESFRDSLVGRRVTDKNLVRLTISLSRLPWR
jgi:hypothetical protein